MTNNKEMEQLEYEDALLQFYTSCTVYGARTVLKDFKSAFPDMFEELLIQGTRIKNEKQLPALFK